MPVSGDVSARIRGADPEARHVIGVMFRLLARRIPPRVLSEWLDWQGCVLNVATLRMMQGDAIEQCMTLRRRAAMLPPLPRHVAELSLLQAEIAFRHEDPEARDILATIVDSYQ